MGDKQPQYLVSSFDSWTEQLQESNVGNYLHGYLSYLKAKSALFEEKYIDKDFLIDYSNYYARSFKNYNKFTNRLHFFSESFSEEEIKNLIETGNAKTYEKLSRSYLGFIVLKPIEDRNGCRLIGRTILKTYPTPDGGDTRFFVTVKNKISLFGMPLEIESLPFQTQDGGVGACASTACWICQYPLGEKFGVPRYSLYEVTNKSIVFPNTNRNFPSSGLTMWQIKAYYNSIGLDTEFIDLDDVQTIPSDIVADAVKAYSNMKLPIIAGLNIKDGDKTFGFHAAVISGYRHKDGSIKELYVHDDQIGTYSRVSPGHSGKFNKWVNEWTTKYGKTELIVEKLMVPIYPKIRLKFGTIYSTFLESKAHAQDLTERLGIEIHSDMLLFELNDYKQYLWNQNFEYKSDILCDSLPRFLWVIRLQHRNLPIIDTVYDGTSIHAKSPQHIIKFQV